MSDQSRNKSQGAKVLTLNWKNLEKDSESEVLLERFTVDKAINLALKELLKKVQSDDNKALGALALILLARQLPEPMKGLILHNAQVAAQSVKEESVKAEILSRLAPQLAESLLQDVFLNIVQSVEDGRAQALENLVPFLSRIPKYNLHPLWTTALHALARRGRADILRDICMLTPIISTLGGTEAVAESAAAIQDTGRWWV